MTVVFELDGGVAVHLLDIFQASAGVEQQNLLIGLDPSALNEMN